MNYTSLWNHFHTKIIFYIILSYFIYYMGCCHNSRVPSSSAQIRSYLKRTGFLQEPLDLYPTVHSLSAGWMGGTDPSVGPQINGSDSLQPHDAPASNPKRPAGIQRPRYLLLPPASQAQTPRPPQCSLSLPR
jgi:hypothetical protein